MRTKSYRLTLLAILALLLAALLPGCSGSSAPTLKVLAGSELQDMEPLLPDIQHATGVRLQLQYSGTLSGAETLLSGGQPYDLAWFSHGKYLDLLQEGRNLVVAQDKTMLSPVVLGVKQSKARALGWSSGGKITWRDIANAASQGQLRFAMTNPAASNSGLTALIGVATALSGSGDALREQDINAEALKGFFRGQALTAGSSGWLADSYVTSQDSLDGIVNYESVLLSLNAGGKLKEKLELIYPQEGIITADYPLMLLNRDKRSDYDRVIAYIRSADFQRKMSDRTLRRPALPGVAANAQIPQALLVELPFPTTLSVIDALLFSYLDFQRVPAHAIFVLDVSGSMSGARLSDLQHALSGLTGLDSSLTGRFSRFQRREKITIISFNDQVAPPQDFAIDDTSTEGADMQRIRDFVNSLQAGGNTAIYSALDAAYQYAAGAQSQDPERYYSIVLMTDGANNDGISQKEFQARLGRLPDAAQGIRTFTVLFGEADPKTMQAIADSTGGRVFDGTKDSLSLIFKQIRGYQ